MADQFCRIVDTTFTDATLGSDAAQSVITTDANTSYIIRDIYKTDSCTSTSFCSTLDLEMDGQKIHTDLKTSASGTVIVPPSSTLCIKDTTGNYPLNYKDSVISKATYQYTDCADDFWTGLCHNSGTDCGIHICRSAQCSVNGVVEAAQDLPVWQKSAYPAVYTNNNNFGMYGSLRFTNNCCYMVQTFEACNCQDRYLTVAFGYANNAICRVDLSYCTLPLFQDDILITLFCQTCLRAWDMSCNQDAWNCGIPTMHCCRGGAFCAYYNCGRSHLSTRQKGCFACRIFTTSPSNSGVNCRFLTTFNLCSGNVCCIAIVCRENCCILPGVSPAFSFAGYWSEKCNTWIALGFTTAGFCTQTGAGVITFRECDCCYRCICTTDLDAPFVYDGACVFDKTMYFRDAYCCLTSLGNTYALYSLETEDFATGISDTLEAKLIDEAFFKGLSLASCYGGTDFCINTSTPDAATITSRGYSISPSSKLTMYGIKST